MLLGPLHGEAHRCTVGAGKGDLVAPAQPAEPMMS
jgi:hypothetical protein